MSGRVAGWLLGVGYATAQLIAMPIGRHPAWDEAIYLTQVTPGAGGTPFAPSRSRGISLLVAPIAGVGLPLTVTRATLVVLSAAALVLAFAAWRPLIGVTAATAAGAVLACSWLAVFYGSEVMPNLWVALLGVASIGLLARHLDGPPSTRAGLVMGSLFAGMALFRPFDALVLGAVSVVLGLRLVRVRWRAVTPIVAGCVLGVLPWLVEMSIRFGGPMAALRGASETGHVSGGSVPERIRQYVLLADGPLIGPQPSHGFPFLGVLWLGVAGVSAWWGIRCSDGVRRTGLLLAAASGTIFIGIYVLLVGGLAPRFLLPGLALVAVPCGAGVVEAWSRTGPVRVAAVILACVWVVSQGLVAVDLGHASEAAREDPAAVGLSLRDLGARPCSFASSESFPEIAYASGCSGTVLTPRSLARGIDSPGAFFVVVRAGEIPAWLADEAGSAVVIADDGWLAYRYG